jgi:MFS family permease
VKYISFGERLRLLPRDFRKFLLAVGLFGAGDFAHTLLILLAVQKLSPAFGPSKAASCAVALYVLHNVCYAGFAFLAGWLADRLPKNLVLAAGYSLAALMAVLIIALPPGLGTLAAVFALGGICVGVSETLEDSFCAELVAEDHHGIAFGALATVNGIGDFISSVTVGALWGAFGTKIAFAYPAALAIAGALLVTTIRPRSPAGLPERR